MSDPWFDPARFGSLYGAIAGGGFGTAGAIIGAMAGSLAPKGRSRWIVLGSMKTVVILGFLQLAFGVVAMIYGQPYGIWYPPALCGFVCVAVMGSLISVVRRRYAAAEKRKLDAEGFRAT